MNPYKDTEPKRNRWTNQLTMTPIQQTISKTEHSDEIGAATGAGVSGAGVTGAGVTGASLTGDGDSGDGVSTGADVAGAEDTGAEVTGASVTGDGVAGACVSSLSSISIVTVSSVMVAPPDGLESMITKSSVISDKVSSVTGMVTVAELSPSSKVIVPLFDSKSFPEVAEPLAVA